jgi:SPOR domain
MRHKSCFCLPCFLLVGLIGCKTGRPGPADVPKYQEDLSQYRIKYAPVAKPKDEPGLTVKVNAPNTVRPTGDIGPELDRLRAAMAENNKNLRYTQGYWVQVYSGGSREEAERVMTSLRYTLAREKPELAYTQPNYKVKVGNFFYKYEAYQLYHELKGQYPNALITAGRISIDLDRYRN